MEPLVQWVKTDSPLAFFMFSAISFLMIRSAWWIIFSLQIFLSSSLEAGSTSSRTGFVGSASALCTTSIVSIRELEILIWNCNNCVFFSISFDHVHVHYSIGCHNFNFQTDLIKINMNSLYFGYYNTSCTWKTLILLFKAIVLEIWI